MRRLAPGLGLGGGDVAHGEQHGNHESGGLDERRRRGVALVGVGQGREGAGRDGEGRVHTVVMTTLTRTKGLRLQTSGGVVRLAMPRVNGLPASNEAPAMRARVAEERAAE